MTEQLVHAFGVAMGLLEIDDRGRIWRIATQKRNGNGQVIPIERRRADKSCRGGYLRVFVWNGQSCYTATASRLVWYHCFGEIPAGMEINHINGHKQDNRPGNLEMVTPSENCIHAFRVLRRPRFGPRFGERNHNSKLTTNIVREIRSRLAAGETQGAIAIDYAISRTAIGDIARGRTWRSVL